MACFTRPEFKVERMSYEVITPSAARGIFEAICWKPAIRWRIERIHILNPIRFASVKRNEVNGGRAAPTAAQMRGEEPMPLYLADEDRAQRSTLGLVDVDYIIDARFTLTEKAGSDDN